MMQITLNSEPALIQHQWKVAFLQRKGGALPLLYKYLCSVPAEFLDKPDCEVSDSGRCFCLGKISYSNESTFLDTNLSDFGYKMPDQCMEELDSLCKQENRNDLYRNRISDKGAAFIKIPTSENTREKQRVYCANITSGSKGFGLNSRFFYDPMPLCFQEHGKPISSAGFPCHKLSKGCERDESVQYKTSRICDPIGTPNLSVQNQFAFSGNVHDYTSEFGRCWINYTVTVALITAESQCTAPFISENLSRICDYAEKKLLSSIQQPYRILAFKETYAGFLQWAQTDAPKELWNPEAGWRRYVKRMEERCKDTKKTFPTGEEAKKAQQYFDSSIEALLKDDKINPETSWACCAAASPSPPEVSPSQTDLPTAPLPQPSSAKAVKEPTLKTEAMR